MSGDFGRLAWVYDALTRLAFLGRLQAAQRAYLNRLPKGQRIAVLGPGTGEPLLELVAQAAPSQLTLVEPSLGMVRRLRARLGNQPQVSIIVQPFPTAQLGEHDVVICPFFLDLFGGEQLPGVVKEIRSTLQPGGLLWVVDFAQADSWWQRAYAWAMRAFFRIAIGAKVPPVQDIRKAVRAAGCEKKDEQTYFGGFIFSTLYR